MTWISRSGNSPAAIRALLIVPDSVSAQSTQTIASAPSSKAASNASWKAPGLAADVVGNGASGAVMRVQNSLHRQVHAGPERLVAEAAR